MSKYSELATFLESQKVNQIEITFSEIEKIISNKLPPSARKYLAWWANSEVDTSHSWSKYWLDSGWKVSHVDLGQACVTFVRNTDKNSIRYWWVNQNQTYQHEVDGGYIWSPKLNANGRSNPFYENMKRLNVGDVIFSFKDTLIPAIGIVTSKAYSYPKPSEFGQTGENWGKEGWCVDIEYHELSNRIRPKDYIDRIRNTLPDKYSPLQANGNGNQGVYLTLVPTDMANILLDLIGAEGNAIVHDLRNQRVAEFESQIIENELQQNTNLENTEKIQLVKSRRGQGIYRTNLERIEKRCRVTGVDAKDHLRASHIKPWKDASNFERLDGNNGLLLSPHIDSLFDRGYISFSDDGEMLISPKTDQNVLAQWGIKQNINVGQFNENQKTYLAYHRANVFIV